MSGSSLTPDEIHTARLLRAEGKTIKQIAWRLRRSRATVAAACHGLKRAVINNVQIVSVPEQVLAEREARLAAGPRDLTAAIAGDPLPGRSALDRKMAGVAAMRARLHSVHLST